MLVRPAPENGQNRPDARRPDGLENLSKALKSAARLLVRLGLAQAHDLIARLELATLFEDFDALETLQDVALRGDGALAFEAAMLRHRKFFGLEKGGGLYG